MYSINEQHPKYIPQTYSQKTFQRMNTKLPLNIKPLEDPDLPPEIKLSGKQFYLGQSIQNETDSLQQMFQENMRFRSKTMYQNFSILGFMDKKVGQQSRNRTYSQASFFDENGH